MERVRQTEKERVGEQKERRTSPGPEGLKKEGDPIWRHFNRLSSDHVIARL